ncbi:MAG: nicotinate-nucleotide adenylyltransferase [Halofilum sp. (in: g-proteobacteria)]|nr:nicotinate-nucleotide adenylyltransferase [Halofilum sp. (in: g-proteobacteria)]
MRRIGLLGGTFDPVHFGHLRPAVEVRAALALDELRLLPCRVSPLRDEPAATAADRVEMLRLALAGQDDLVLDPRELERPPPSYTADTLAELRAEAPDARLHFIMGADAFAGFGRWARTDEILQLAHLVVTRRPGVALETPPALAGRVSEEPADLERAASGRVLLLSVTQLDISASAIRRLAAAGGDLRYLLPEPARDYLERNRLYRDASKGERRTG